jgi:hypothetical protein
LVFQSMVTNRCLYRRFPGAGLDFGHGPK